MFTRKSKKEKKLVRTKFGQEKIGHARGGLKSMILAVLVLVMLLLLLLAAFMNEGRISLYAGLLCIVMGYMDIKGIYYGVLGFKERNKRYFWCKAGIGANSGILLCLVLLFIRGLI
ncbi:hypothetical protein M2454_001952 [Aequitasia blattaphilus]|uniref:DUF6142 family protein n=1 Tax=Aequitasia blattaphilus TaxID=2949332 RepID=A0ABT1E9Z0_9FIRM|nr:DUF6142 family protein [Aequitasia blattaphilus]MCP1102638.1 DUF6142 family protein [Aequitasia blattaphilus]MCR8615278.1 DUF6142 family protein [Aequitasia blattaphilus]